MKQVGNGIYHIIKNICFAVKISYCASKKYFCAKSALMLVATAVPLVTIRLWKEILNGISSGAGDISAVAVYLAAYLCIQFAVYLAAKIGGYINMRYWDEITFYIDGIMIEKTSKMDLMFFDSADMNDKLSNARSNFDILHSMPPLVFNIISEIITIVTTVAIVSAYKWWIGIITVLLLIPSVVYDQRYNKIRYQLNKEQIRDNRKMGYAEGVFFDNGTQFEIKLNDIGNYFIEKYTSIWKKLFKINRKADISHIIRSSFFGLINIFSEVMVLFVSVNDVASGSMLIGDLQYNISMVSRLRSQASKLFTDVNSLMLNNERINELQEFMSICPEIEKSGTLIPKDNPKIEFSHVYFKYYNTDRYVLNDCSFVIESGEKIGLIGLNGAGKSTIIKLMFRFYDPESGEIKLDGINIKEYDVYAVRRVFGVLFQDYVTYCLPLREIIALSDFENRYDDERLKYAADISGVSGIISKWEDGFDSVLGRYYTDNGKDLSGGQWQLVSLARAYFRDTRYMVLDEPSAALDPISEDRIFEQLYHLSEGKASVTISHRLSNTTLADKILVLEDGKIIEQGSHFELLKQGGKYAHLFNLQAEKYK